MVSEATLEECAALADAQRQRAALHTRGDSWRTAAVMTCFGAPFGLLFGVAALLVMRGLHAAIEGGHAEKAEKKLQVGRSIVLAGTACGALGLLFGLVEAVSMAFEFSKMLERMRAGGYAQ